MLKGSKEVIRVQGDRMFVVGAIFSTKQVELLGLERGGMLFSTGPVSLRLEKNSPGDRLTILREFLLVCKP